MGYSKITITFTSGFNVADYINIEYFDYDAINTFYANELVGYIRQANGQITWQSSYSDVNNSAAAYEYYFNIDYNRWGDWTVTRVGNVVTIESNRTAVDFTSVTSNNPGIIIVVENYNWNPSTFAINSTSISAAVNICSNWKLTVDANENIAKFLVDGAEVLVTPPAMIASIEPVRGVKRKIEVVNETGVVLLVGNAMQYDYLLSKEIVPIITIGLTGATVTIRVDNSIGLTLQYSLDGTNWISSNILTGQTEGNYTIYVKDQFGCIKTKDYTIDSVGTPSPFLFISKANSINYSVFENWDGYNTFKNEENSLSFDDFTKNNDCAKLLFQTNDVTRTQFKSNFNNISAVLRDFNYGEWNLTLEKKTANLNRFMRLDCTYYKYKTGKVGVYFITGNSYNEVDTPIGTYTLNGNLPDFAVTNNLVNIDGLGAFSITDILYDENINKRVLIVDYDYEGADTQSKISSYYNLLPFEVWEFEIDWSLYGVGKYYVLITNTNSEGSFYHVSENIYIEDVHEDTLAVRYYNNNNRDVFYKYGIQHFIRLPYSEHIAKPLTDNTITINDDSSHVIKSDVNEIDEITFIDLTRNMMRKVVIALSCEELYINGIKYVTRNIDASNLSNTNIYEVKAELVKSENNYNNKFSKFGVDATYDELDIPTLLTTGTGFIKT